MELQISRIIFSGNNPQGTFVAGDVLEVFVETDDVPTPLFITTIGVYAKKNGVLITSGPFVDSNNQPYKTMIQYNPQFCAGSYLVTPGYLVSYPYGSLVGAADHYSCTVNPPTCDLVIIGQPEVLPSSGTGQQDGIITITAQSSNSIRYKIGSDFSYEDGTGQDDNSFYELLPGDYRIYISDSKNCKANVLVNVPINNTYGPKYRLEYDDLIGGKTRVDISQRAYIGSVTSVCGTGTPFTLNMRGEGDSDKFIPMLATEAVIELLTSTDGEFRDTYTNDPELYRIYAYKSTVGIFDNIDPFTGYPLSTWTNISGPGANWNTGISAPSVKTSGTSDWISSPISGIPSGSNFIYISAATSARYTLEIQFLKVGLSVGSVITSRITNNETISSIITLSDIPDEVRIRAIGSNGNYSLFLVSVSMPIGVQSIWQGKVIPGIIEENYRAAPYTFTIRATDGLPKLKDIYLIQDDGQSFYGKVSIIKLIAYCLSKTKILLNIRVACNLYAVGMTTTTSSDPLHQSYVDYDLFYLFNERPTLEQVIEIVLNIFGARLIQWDSFWNIVRIEENVGEYDYRVFDSDGVYVDNSSFNPVLDLGYPNDNEPLHYVRADQNLEIKPGFGTIRVVYDLGYKENILRNGDFRLKSVYDAISNKYTYSVNTDGFTIVNGPYAKQIGYTDIEAGNIALMVSFPFNESGGQGYIKSDTYAVKMGANNQLKIIIKYMVPDGRISFGSTVFNDGTEYNKVRLVVRYGDLYLTSGGTWVGAYNEVTIFASDFFKYQEYELVANQPVFPLYDSLTNYSLNVVVYSGGTHWVSLQNNNTNNTPASGVWWQSISVDPVGGMSFSVQIFDAYIFHADFNSLTTFRDFDTKYRTEGYKTQFYGELGSDVSDRLYYYELKEGTDADNPPNIIRGTDFNASTNPKVWVMTSKIFVTFFPTSFTNYWIDRIQVQFLTDSKEPINAIIRERQGEVNNNDLYIKEFYIGSYSNLIVTNQYFQFGFINYYNAAIGVSSAPTLITVTENALSPELIYAGYLRSGSGDGWENWARVGIAESDKLHGIMLRVYAAQYKKSWRRMRGSFRSNTHYFGLLNVIREINGDNRIYMPVSISIDDKNNIYSGELLELANIYENPGSDGSGEAPYSSGFTTGFGSSGFN